MWRAAEMTWVDILLDRRSTATVISLLADSQTFEMRSSIDNRKCSISKRQKAALLELQGELRTYHTCLPESVAREGEQGQTAISLDQALPKMEQGIHGWIEHIRPLTETINTLEAQLFEWQFLAYCLEHIPDESLSLGSFSEMIRHKPFVGTGMAKGLTALQADSSVLLKTYPLAVEKQHSDQPDTVFVGLMSGQDSDGLERGLRATGSQFAKVPDELSGSPSQAFQWLQNKVEAHQAQIVTLKDQIEQYSNKHQIGFWNTQLLRWLWLSEVMNQAWCNERFVQICGWVPAQKLGVLETVLKDSAGPYLLRKGNADEHGEPPVLLDNGAWVKLFEPFVRGFGVPRVNEVDPTPVLALTTPLMFGFMFGDVGQGAVLVVLGYFLRDRLPILGLLIPAGISAIIFGFLHGTIFCNETLIKALWLHPLDYPLTIMTVALLFGAAMLLVSLILAGVQAYWERRTASWAARQLPLIGLCLALPALLWNTTLSGILVLAATLLSVVLALGKGGLAGALLALLKLLEDGVQLAINMLSFIRLGAFTLAHCGLSSAVMVLTAIPDNIVLQSLIFVLGNILVIAMEGLVVSIQTTRLVMFEFFRRFMEGTGRPFKPLTDPATF